jgi:hypothetical protein
MKKIILLSASLLAVVSLTACGSSAKKEPSLTDKLKTAQSKLEDASDKLEDASASTPKTSTSSSKEDEALKGLSGNALAQAKQAISYLKYSHMSKTALYDQLTSEYGSKMTAEEANAAITKIDPFINWQNLVVLEAKSYRETANLTGQDLMDQLSSEYGGKWSVEEATYGVENIDTDVKDDAIWK